MNFSKFDFVMTVTMALAVISLSFVMPALGLTQASTSESEIPEFSVDTDAFDVAGDMPESPGTPGRGELTMDESRPDPSDYQVSLDDEVTLLQLEQATDPPQMLVNLLEDTTGNFSQVSFANASEGDRKRVSEAGYTVDVTLENVENFNQSDFTWTVEWQIVEEPDEDKSFIDRIPIVGGAVQAGESLAQIVGWIGSLIWWGFASVVEFLVNAAVMIAQSMFFMFETATWLVSTYSEVVSAAASWASIFVAIPGLILFLEFAKAAMIGVSLLPFT